MYLSVGKRTFFLEAQNSKPQLKVKNFIPSSIPPPMVIGGGVGKKIILRF